MPVRTGVQAVLALAVLIAQAHAGLAALAALGAMAHAQMRVQAVEAGAVMVVAARRKEGT